VHPQCAQPSGMTAYSPFLERAIILFESACRRAYHFRTTDGIAAIASTIIGPVSSRATFGACTTLQCNPELALGLALESGHIECNQTDSIIQDSLIVKAKAAVASASSERREATAPSAERIALWLSKHPHELNKSKSDAAALKVLANLCVEKQYLRHEDSEGVDAQVTSHLKHLVISAINAVDVRCIPIFTQPPIRTPMFYALVKNAVRTLAEKSCAAEAKAAKLAERGSTSLAGRKVSRVAEARALRNLRAARRNANSTVAQAETMEPLHIGPSRRALQKAAHHRRYKQQRLNLNLERGKPDTKPKFRCTGRSRDRDAKFIEYTDFDDT